MRKLQFIILGCILLLSGCEDKKKTFETPEQTVSEADSGSSVEKEKEDKKPSVRYPKITNENAVSFLTEYGEENPETKVRIETYFGEIDIELYRDTPLHRANFIYLVKQGYFDESVFHRVVPEFIIQAGNSDTRNTQEKRAELGKDYLLPAEIIKGRIHEYGTVSGAKEYRENPDNRSAPYEFFIFLGPNTSARHLNGSYTIFGRVVKGMDVVETISEIETDSEEWPLQNIYIKAYVLE